MTIKRTYECDLCHQSGSPTELHGLHWGHSGWVKGVSSACEHHICEKCLDSVTAIGNEYANVRPVTKGKEGE